MTKTLEELAGRDIIDGRDLQERFDELDRIRDTEAVECPECGDGIDKRGEGAVRRARSGVRAAR